MTHTNVVQLTQPGTFADPLTEVLRNARAGRDDCARSPLNELAALRAEMEALRGDRAKILDLPNPIRRGAA